MAHRPRLAFITALAIASALAVGIRAQSGAPQQLLPTQISDEQPAAAMNDETPQLWFVELASPPTADGTSLAQVRREKASFRAAAAAARLNYTERYAFDTLWNGFSVRVAPKDIAALGRIPGVKAIYPVIPVTYEQQAANDPNLFTAITMTGADVVQSELGYTGKGVNVAIIDTGIDYNHPDLGGCFGPGCRVEKGFDFVGDAYDAGGSGDSLVPHPDNDPMDCAGHGTHVSGIVGAKAAGAGGVTGVAPGVTFYAYRVFGCSGSTSSDIMIAAMERAFADKADVINMSIGSAFQWPEYPSAVASDRMVNRGIVVVASAGNNGANGLYSLGAPSVGSKVISVASFDNTYVYLPYFTVSSVANKGFGYIAATGAPTPPTSGTFPMARTGTTTSTADACTALPDGSLAGEVVLIRRGTCSFNIKAYNAQQAGAAGVILYNNTSGFLSPTVAGPPTITIPVVAITQIDGAVLNAQIAGGPTTMTWSDQLASFPNPTGGLISSFSSYGLSPDLDLKPDIGAPGGSIYSTYPLALGGYATLSGTSMSSPHVAGAVALLLEAKPHTVAHFVRAILQNSAEPKNWFGNPGLGFLDNVHRQGAGMLRIDRAILATTKVEPGKLSLGDTAGPVTRTLTIVNSSNADVTYTLSHTAALATGSNTFTPTFSPSFASVAFSAPTISVAAGGSATVDVTITAPTAPDKGMYGGYLIATPGTGQAVRVPYAGFIGNYQSIQVLTSGGSGFPLLAQVVGANYVPRSDADHASFTLQDGDVPFILAHFNHQSRLVDAEVIDANTGKSWKTAFEFDYFGRNSTSTGFYALPWDGTTSTGNKTFTVPNGQYKIVLTVVKALGNRNNPADVETWTSPTFAIARP